jgi:hypothetical protein
MNMHSDNGNSKQAQEVGVTENSVLKNRFPWERPALRRLDAADAERAGGTGGDANAEKPLGS